MKLNYLEKLHDLEILLLYVFTFKNQYFEKDF